MKLPVPTQGQAQGNGRHDCEDESNQEFRGADSNVLPKAILEKPGCGCGDSGGGADKDRTDKLETGNTLPQQKEAQR
jgi:hypothetical protein